jgi:hypothetical protein
MKNQKIYGPAGSSLSWDMTVIYESIIMLTDAITNRWVKIVICDRLNRPYATGALSLEKAAKGW